MNNNILLNYLKRKDWIFGRLRKEKSRWGVPDWYLFSNCIFTIESKSLIQDKKFMKEILKQVGEDRYSKFLNGEKDTLYGDEWKHHIKDINQIMEKMLNITPKTQEDIDKLPTIYPMNLVITDPEGENADKMIYFDQDNRNIIILNRDFYDMTCGASLKFQYGHYGQPLLYKEGGIVIWIMPVKIIKEEEKEDDLKILIHILEEMVEFRGENREWLEVE